MIFSDYFLELYILAVFRIYYHIPLNYFSLNHLKEAFIHSNSIYIILDLHKYNLPYTVLLRLCNLIYLSIADGLS